jgi:hypothetical protein
LLLIEQHATGTNILERPAAMISSLWQHGTELHAGRPCQESCSNEVGMTHYLKRLLLLQMRRRRRYRTSGGLYVIFDNFPGKHVVDDISSGGLSYHYVDNGLRPKNGAYGLKVLTESPRLSVELAGKTISDHETGELIFQNKKIKRRSIRFERMNSRQKQELKDLIKISRRAA